MRRKNHDLNAIENDSIKFSIHTPPVSQERVTSQEVPHPKQTGSTKQGTVSLRDTLPSSQFSGMQDIEFLAIVKLPGQCNIDPVCWIDKILGMYFY